MSKKIIRAYESTRFTPTREVESVIIVEYKIDEFGPFIMSLKKDNFSWSKVKELIEAEELEIKKITQ